VEGKPVKVWIKNLEFPVLLFKQGFKNIDKTVSERFLASNDLTLTDEQFTTLYKKRWSIEEYHKSLKQNISIGNSPAQTERTQSNHIFSSIYRYVKLEKMKLATGLNHYAFKERIYIALMKAAIIQFQGYWKSIHYMAFAKDELYT